MLPSIPRIAPNDRLLSRPSWNDAGLMVFANEWKFSTFTTDGVSTQILAPPNPKRWAIGFSNGTGAAIATLVSPMNDPATWGEPLTALFRDRWYTIFDFGPWIQGEWYVSCAAVQLVGIVEIEIGSIENVEREL